jgi:hypothetical protein
MPEIELWTHGNQVQVQDPENLADLSVTRWSFGAELSLTPQANPPQDKLYTLNLGIPTPVVIDSAPCNLDEIFLKFNTFFKGKVQSVGSSGEIRRVDVFDGAVRLTTFTDILEGTDVMQIYPLNPSHPVSNAIQISLGYRFETVDRGAFLIIGVGARFIYPANV